jgi:hypothetical protein
MNLKLEPSKRVACGTEVLQNLDWTMLLVDFFQGNDFLLTSNVIYFMQIF